MAQPLTGPQRAARPPRAAIERFGGDPGLCTPLAGPNGGVWRCGGIVLKRAGDDQEVRFVSAALAALNGRAEFRVAPPFATADGAWTVSGWSAAAHLDGDPDPSRWIDTARLCAVFHERLAAAALDWPPSLDARQTPWAIADRVAWGEAAVPDDLPDEVLDLVAAAGELDRPDERDRPEPRQVIHGDFAGNVLYRDGVAPAVIDFSPYRRPAAFATAIVVADQVAWGGAPADHARGFVDGDRGAGVLLVRAVVFRIVAAWLQRAAGTHRVQDEVERYGAVLVR